MSVSHSIREAVGIVNAARSISSVVAVVSESRRRPGVAAVTYELAMGLARSRRQVAVVDCDLTVPLLHERLLRPAHPGLTSVLQGDRMIEDVIEYEPVDVGQLMTVTAGADGPEHVAMLDSSEAFDGIERLRELNDLVILLGGPLDSTAGQDVARLADAVVLVVADTHEADAEIRPSSMNGIHAFVVAWTIDPTSGLNDLLDLEYGDGRGFGGDSVTPGIEIEVEPVADLHLQTQRAGEAITGLAQRMDARDGIEVGSPAEHEFPEFEPAELEPAELELPDVEVAVFANLIEDDGFDALDGEDDYRDDSEFVSEFAVVDDDADDHADGFDDEYVDEEDAGEPEIAVAAMAEPATADEPVPAARGAVAFAQRVNELVVSRSETPPTVDDDRDAVAEFLSGPGDEDETRPPEPSVMPEIFGTQPAVARVRTNAAQDGALAHSEELVDAWMAQYDFSDEDPAIDRRSPNDGSKERRKRSLLNRVRSPRYMD